MPEDMSDFEIPVMSPEMAARSTMEGWVIGLLATGYKKANDFTMPSGNTITVYVNEEAGKTVVLGVTKTGEWIGFYPRCGFWSGAYHEGKTDIPPDEWTEKTPEQLRDDLIEKMKGADNA